MFIVIIHDRTSTYDFMLSPEQVKYILWMVKQHSLADDYLIS